MVVGGGSSNLKTRYEVTPLEALEEAYGEKVSWVRGYVGDVSTSYNKVSTGQDLSDSRSSEELIAEAVAEAGKADLVIFIGGLNKSANQDNEGTDRVQLDMPYGQESVIRAIAAVNPQLVVVNISGSPVSMPWAEVASAIVQSWYGGTETGHALVDVLSGAVNPSGKLPFTVPCSLEDGPLKTERQYPGVREEGKRYWQEYYDEGIFVGYRWYDTKGIKVQFPFGYGLSYTTFDYSGAKAGKSLREGGSVKVSVNVRNTGDRDGAEVVELYVAAPEIEGVERAAKELKGFEKIFLKAGESRTVTFTLTPSDISRFDPEAHKWVADKGTYKALFGTSSADILAEATFEMK